MGPKQYYKSPAMSLSWPVAYFNTRCTRLPIRGVRRSAAGYPDRVVVVAATHASTLCTYVPALAVDARARRQ